VIRAIGFTLAGVVAVCEYVSAETYPSKPITLIVPVAPGGATSTTGFMLRDKLRDRLKQPIVVDHRPGANGIIGTTGAAKASPDGYTILLASMSHITLNPNLYKNLPYAPVRDFAPVSLVSTFPLLLVVHPSVPARSVKEFIGYAKVNAGRINYGSSGQGNSNHMAGELLKDHTGIDMTHVPYKGGGGLVTAVLGNEVSVIFSTPQSIIAHVTSNRVRLLAVSSAARSSLYPDVPTVSESGAPGFAVDTWNGVLVPAGTPRDIIVRLHAEIVRVLEMPATRIEMLKSAMEPVIAGTDMLARTIKSETERWGKLIRERGLSLD
jgi:tripartite-type tricarboxylate transporter receptor subunit TctC